MSRFKLFLSRHSIFIAAVLFLTTGAFAGTIKVWVTGEVLRSSDLNANFAHIHNRAERSLTNIDISPTAAIAHSKLATPALIPKALLSIRPDCVIGVCAEVLDIGATSVTTWLGVGNYRVTWTTARPNLNYVPLVTIGKGGLPVHCLADLITTTKFDVFCTDINTNAPIDSQFYVVIYDDNP